MSYFSEMEWNANWDWENLVAFSSKAIESPRKPLFVDAEIDPSSFNMSGPGGSSGTSSTKSSISASIDSPTMQRWGYSGNFGKARGTDVSGTSPLPEASIGSMEPLISLELGERTYFENNSAGGNAGSTSLSVMPNNPSTTTTQKKVKSSQNAPIPRCQVEGCDLDLSTAKEYHRKHRVCECHSKCSKVVIKGLERRFCQQCSRFHSLSEFDDKKRSCRRRLSDHNARRRKPQQESIQFNSTRLSSPFHGGRQQMSFLLNNAPFLHSKTPAYSTWDGESNSKFTLTKGNPLRSNGDDGVITDEQLGIKTTHAMNMQSNATNGILASKGSSSEVMYPGGSKGSSLISSPHLDARRALSLLSNSSSWGSCGPESIQVQHPMHEDGTSTMMHGIPEGLPLSCTDFWLTGQNSTPHPRVQSLATNNNFQEFQLSKTSYESDFYSNMLN
ncbi:hypothetical protein ACJIZ3_010439 [Penstemon smallii]|uniref:SBP-type domain-containing protein n=1 Tax=Penstemon smallii TaxID=265156 RepID=A0ABD3TGR7_9LAMI